MPQLKPPSSTTPRRPSRPPHNPPPPHTPKLATRHKTNAQLTTDLGSGGDAATAVVIGPDYKITVVGRTWDDFAIARYKVTTALEERTYYQQDANHNVTSLADAFGSIAERYIYDPYGTQTVLTPTFTTTKESLGNTHGFQGGIQGEEKVSGIEY